MSKPPNIPMAPPPRLLDESELLLLLSEALDPLDLQAFVVLC